MLQFREEKYVEKIPTNIECILGADIGGTNSNFGIFEVINKDLRLILSLHLKSQQIKNFASELQGLLAYLQKTYGIAIAKSCIGTAGVVSQHRDSAKPTNLDFVIDVAEIYSKTTLTCCFLVNDFEIIGYGLARIDPKNIVKVKKGTERPYAQKGIIGAGTGLGKCLMAWDEHAGRYRPHASEGGHADFPVQNQLELDLVHFIQESEQFACNISWENVLNGNGIQRIYRFFHSRSNAHNFSEGEPHPDEIFKARLSNEHSLNTFALYTRFYARCAKDYALDALTLGGIYIAGGIAAKNLPLFELPEFHDEFVNCGKQQELLAQIPIYVITDYNVSLYGAAEYMILEGLCD